jgi:succinate dehydrogenase / fumarate reductase, cytochrome b subunit
MMSEAKLGQGAKVNRPLSPHLMIYTPLINMVMSFGHRLTGAALYFGTLLLAWWLIAAASGPDYFSYVNGLLASWPGKIVLAGYSWALIHHAIGGIRHFVWDAGLGYGLKTIDRMSWGSLVLSVLLTALVWASAFKQLGGV